MKRKLFTLLLAVAASVGTIFAEPVKIGDLYYNLNDEDKTAEVKSSDGDKYSGDIVIPSSVEYNSVVYTVTSIGKEAFERCSSLTSVTIPNSVVSIGYAAFFNCSSLTSVTIGNSVTEIGEYAFGDCKELTSVTIGNSVTSIGRGAFRDCTSLISIEIPNGVTSIGYMAFSGCKGLTSINIPNSVTSIEESVFSNCTSLPVEDNLRYADTYLVEAVDKSLSSYTIKAGTRWIGPDAFAGGTDVTSIDIPNSVVSIGYRAFFGCKGLTSINIPNSVTSIGGRVFCDCTGLTSINIPNSVTSIGEGICVGCYNLSSIIVESSNATYDSRKDCNAIIESTTNTLIAGCKNTIIPNGVTSIGNLAFSGCKGLTSINIPNGVTSIGKSAFSLCSSLTSVTIPNSVTSIGQGAFIFCSGLTSIEIPNSVTSIGESAFANCTGLTSLTIPNSVTSIGESAFVNCTGLTSLTIPNSVTSIGYEAFCYCTGLTSLTIGTGVTSIDGGAFAECTGLTSVTCYATNPIELPMYASVFNAVDCSKIPLYVPANSIDLYKTANQWKDFNPILPISAKDTETNTVKAEPTETSVDVTWPSVAGAYTYELVIKDKNGKVICTLVFNAQGQLLSIAFNAPANGKAPQQTQTAGFSFVITGLDEGTDYDLTITAKGENGNELDKKNVTFHTNGSTGIEDIIVDKQKATKILLDGQIYILRGEHVYDAQGKMVR